MTPAQQIQINELLLHREEAFARIHALEQEIESILGAKYPFILPELPSHAKRKKPRAKNKAKAKPFKLRALEPSEAAYQITYLQDGLEHSETHQKTAALERLIHLQTEQLQVVTITTLDASDAICEKLYPGL